MNCFRVDYSGRGELADRQQKLNQFLSRLAHMAEGKIRRPSPRPSPELRGRSIRFPFPYQNMGGAERGR